MTGQDIRGQPCAFREEVFSLSTDGLSHCISSRQMVIQVKDRNVHDSSLVAGIVCATTTSPVIVGNNPARMFEHEVITHKQTAFIIHLAQQYVKIRLL